MDTYHDRALDSPSKNSYIGSYYQPPDRIPLAPIDLELPATSLPGSHTSRNIDSIEVIDALKTLQEKIRHLELDRKQAEKHFHQYSRTTRNYEQYPSSSSSFSAHRQPAASPPAMENKRKDVDSKLHSAEARCKVLEKQSEYMRRMVGNANKERNAVLEEQASIQTQKPPSSFNPQSQREKLDRLESECLKLSKTQTLAEMKLAVLEQKLLKEEQERKIMQEKADELERELDIGLRLSAPAAEEINPKTKKKKTTKRSPTQNEPTSASYPRCKQIPFLCGTSTSPSHSVHANVQSVLHMMKHHQPQLCERVHALHSYRGKSPQKDFPAQSTSPHRPERADLQSLGSLSDLLLALQDELGQMSFEQQELVRQIETTDHREHRELLKTELERLVARMDEKGAQISKLHKHQRTVHKLTQQQRIQEAPAKKPSGIRPLVPTPVKAKQKSKKSGGNRSNLQLLKDTKKFRNRLQRDDVSWVR
ncbi:centrosomal protein CEP57L1 [Genypterus blacodes]|uniref:centrosomal protein CEP57L1 n=1 Tax=Genypterus blacodes TaxID=154954 RepID=UPI003F75F63E